MTRTGRDGTQEARQAVGPRRRRVTLGLVAAALAGIAGAFVLAGPGPWRAAAAQEQVRTIAVSARRYAFKPATIEVQQDQLVRIVLTAEDVAHSFTIDEYRIAKRAGPGRSITFEFRADRPGRFTYYCNLKSDEGCRDMRGTLVVNPR